MKRILFFLMTCLSVFSLHEADAQCDNLALAFEGSTNTSPIGDFVNLNPSPVSGNSDFTVEGWFLTTGAPLGIPQFRRLFTLAGTTRFEVGENGSNLVLFWSDATPSNSFNVLAPISTSTWYHLAVVRQGATVLVYLNGVVVGPPLIGLGALNTNLFHVGHWGGGNTPTQDWEGQVDEVRLWNTVRTPAQILDFKDCSLSFSSVPSDLLVNWTFDQTAQGAQSVSGGGNNSNITGLNVVDMSGNLNHGTLNNFTLNGSTSNFVCNRCPPLYGLVISDLPTHSIPLTDICSGDPAHFCVTENGVPVSPALGATVDWEYFDVGYSTVWQPVTNPAIFSGFCFGIQNGQADLTNNVNCNIISPGNVDRKFRAIIKKTSGSQTCTYVTSEYNLKICCPPTSATISLSPLPPATTACEGDILNYTVFLNPNDPWLPFGIPNVNIDWCLIDQNGTNLLPQFHNQLAFTLFPLTVGTVDICLQAKISNCTCPPILVEICINVDPLPMCGQITGVTVLPTLCPDPDLNPDHYLICPGDDATVGMVNPPDFKNCNPVWQYHFDVPANDPWKDMGTSNPNQNTNSLPQTDPPNPPNPSVWPVGANYIFYRIQCRPLSYPNSGCPPCHSNELRVGLKPPPATPILDASPPQICDGQISTLSVLNYDPNLQYDWFCNGLYIGSGPYVNVALEACYWVVVTDGCYKVESPKFCLPVCEVVAKIACPTDNPCACLGQPITLDGSASYSDCGGALQYLWSWDSGTDVSGQGTSMLIHNPDPNGTTYTLVVIDQNGCSMVTQLFIKPCQ
jgi:hypothetical protein